MMNNMNPTEPKPQTPLTDARQVELNRLGFVEWRSKMLDHARSLELKLQEAERQRDEAWKLANSKAEESGMFRAERDQLIKVVDELVDALKHGLGTHGDSCSAGDSCSVVTDGEKALEAYSLLLHVQAKKGNKK